VARNPRAKRPRDGPFRRRVRVGVNFAGWEFDALEDFARSQNLSIGAAARMAALAFVAGERLRSDHSGIDKRIARLSGR
jgi:hypothetical protein